MSDTQTHAQPTSLGEHLDPEVARQYAQYLQLVGLARLVSESSVWEDGTSSSVASFVVGYPQPRY